MNKILPLYFVLGVMAGATLYFYSENMWKTFIFHCVALVCLIISILIYDPIFPWNKHLR
jgi:membrane protein YdbS with pleckstrin-like domain